MRNMKRQLLMMLFGAVVLCFGSASRVDAVPFITMTDQDGTSVVLVDNSVVDNDPNAGLMNFTGGVGTWDVLFTIAMTKPMGTGGLTTVPFMNIQAFSAVQTVPSLSGLAGQLDFTFNEADFDIPVFPPGTNALQSAIGGTAGGTIDFEFFYGANNQKGYDDLNFNGIPDINELTGDFGTSMHTVTASGGAISVPSDFFTQADGYTPVIPYSLTIAASIKSDMGVSSGINVTIAPATVANLVNPVPEPSTILLFGLGLAGLGGGYFRRRIRRNKSKVQK